MHDNGERLIQEILNKQSKCLMTQCVHVRSLWMDENLVIITGMPTFNVSFLQYFNFQDKNITLASLTMREFNSNSLACAQLWHFVM